MSPERAGEGVYDRTVWVERWGYQWRPWWLMAGSFDTAVALSVHGWLILWAAALAVFMFKPRRLHRG